MKWARNGKLLLLPYLNYISTISLINEEINNPLENLYAYHIQIVIYFYQLFFMTTWISLALEIIL